MILQSSDPLQLLIVSFSLLLKLSRSKFHSDFTNSSFQRGGKPWLVWGIVFLKPYGTRRSNWDPINLVISSHHLNSKLVELPSFNLNQFELFCSTIWIRLNHFKPKNWADGDYALWSSIREWRGNEKEKKTGGVMYWYGSRHVRDMTVSHPIIRR